ncbi:auxin-responsive protein SAUR68-like [Solanum lycopersicum]|uniref:auxin-responsive protein SAUR68-like n=1 Tax=Solanum lycopersicum TaxID=4081 RepID=UPI0037498BA9
MNMISAKKLIKMARKWQKFAAKQRKRSSFPRSNSNDLESCSTSSTIVSKGNFVVYKPDQKQFVVPLAYLQHEGVLDQLSGMGVKLDDEIQGLWLLNTLLDSWETLRVSLTNSAPSGVVTM